MGKGISEGTKHTVLVILFVCTLYPVEPVQAFDVLIKISTLHKGGNGKTSLLWMEDSSMRKTWSKMLW